MLIMVVTSGGAKVTSVLVVSVNVDNSGRPLTLLNYSSVTNLLIELNSVIDLNSIS